MKNGIMIRGRKNIDQNGGLIMNQKERKELFNSICSTYKTEMWIHSGDSNPYSIVLYKEVVMPKKAFSRPSAWDIMCLLHEIGHIKTNKECMPTCEKEYLATQWSVNEARIIGFKIEDIWKECFQDYIWNYFDEEKNELTNCSIQKEDLIVSW